MQRRRMITTIVFDFLCSWLARRVARVQPTPHQNLPLDAETIVVVKISCKPYRAQQKRTTN